MFRKYSEDLQKTFKVLQEVDKENSFANVKTLFKITPVDII